MKAAFAVVFVLSLFASTGNSLAQEGERSPITMSDSFDYEGGEIESEREGAWRACTTQEWNIAFNHCYVHHTNLFVTCNLTSCTAQSGRIAYSWSGYTWGLFS